MEAKLFVLFFLAFRVSASVGSARNGQPSEAFVDKLKALASALGNKADVGTPAAASGTPEAAIAAAQPAPPVQAPPATEQAPTPTQPEAPAGTFMKSLDALRSMLGSKSTAAVATSSVAAEPSSTEEKPAIEQRLNALKGLLHPSSPPDAIAAVNAPQSTQPSPISVAAQASEAAPVPTGGVVATSSLSKDKTDVKSNRDDKDGDDDEDDDEDSNDDADQMAGKMAQQKKMHAALKAPVAGAQTNGQRVAKMASQYIKHVPAHTMLNKRPHRTDPIRP